MQELNKEQKRAISRLEKIFKKAVEVVNPDFETNSGLCGTPKRMARAWVEDLLRGVWLPEPTLAEFPLEVSGDAELVVLRDIQVVSMCEHHFLNFTGTAIIGYLPKDKVVGVSKLARITDYYARRPQIQERLTNEIADAVDKAIDPAGVGVFISARHSCMTCRGVMEPHSVLETTALRGEFQTGKVRDEFLACIRGG